MQSKIVSLSTVIYERHHHSRQGESVIIYVQSIVYRAFDAADKEHVGMHTCTRTKANRIFIVCTEEGDPNNHQ
jgi:hypothetical protein